MTRTELVRAVAAPSGMNLAEADAAVNAVLVVLTQALGRGEAVRPSGFGTFETRDRPARTGRDPRSGASVAVLASRRVRLRAATALLVAAAAVFVAAAAADISAARAGPADRLWEELQNQAGGCGTAGDKSLSEGTFCLAGAGLAFLFEEGVRQAQDYGRTAFGQHFGMIGNAALAGGPDSAGLAGDLDIVVPLAGGGPAQTGRSPGSALFLQQGVTRWQDGSSSFRDDLRYGLAWRFRASDRPGADILGLSLLQLQDAERRHRVVVPGIDYAGRWGTGSLRSFIPATGWRPGPPGREERAPASAVEVAADPVAA